MSLLSKSRFITAFFFFFYTIINAQPFHDANWILGATLNKGTQLVFSKDSVKIQTIPTPIPADGDLVTISDKKGQLIAYSNGCAIANRKHKIMDNGLKINPGKEHYPYCYDVTGEIMQSGYPMVQGMVFLPYPQDTNLYALFHIPVEISPKRIFSYPLYQSTVDKSQNNGDGRVTFKNKPILNDSIHTGHIFATRHANGKDWWIVVARSRSNLYYKLLFTEKGIEKIDTQSIGDIWEIDSNLGRLDFSPDGTQFARIMREYKINLFDFDRCSGRFSNPRYLEYRNPKIIETGLAFSPNSRFLYATTGNELY
jgi:hypothetical protein